MNLDLPTITSYGEYKSDNYGAHTLRVTVGPMVVWFSYQTPVAFVAPSYGLVVSENCWGPTTGKHLNWIDGGDRQAKRERLPREEFERRLTEAQRTAWAHETLEALAS